MKIQDVLVLKRGYDLPESKRINGQYLIYSSNGIAGSHNEYKVKGPAVITGRSGSLGTVQYTENNCWPLNTTLYVSDFKGNNPKYISYLLQMLHLEKYGSGSAVPTLNRNHLDNLEVTFHSLIEQQHIVDIIGSIDYKIENNNKIIEKSYELLDLRMKKLMIGKSKKIISDFKEIEIIGSGINKFDREKIYLDTSCVAGNSIIDTSYNVSYNERPSRANMQPIINSVWFAKLKNSPKHIIVKDYSNEILNNYVFSTGFMGIKMPEEKFDLLAIYFISDIFDKEKDSLSIGATMQSINNNTFKNMYIPKFIENDYKEFNDISNDILKAIYSMELENYKLNKLKQLYLKKFFG